jgi:hypothetical protein
MATPDFHQERQRLLCLMKSSPDHYELAFASAEHAGYLRGLRDSGVIGGAAHELYAAEAEQVVQTAMVRLCSALDEQAA